MLYLFLKYTMRLVLPVYYRKISLEGIKNIPPTGPVLLACSHPNSFLDAILIGTYSPRPLHFLTRSDVFNARWKQWILSKMNMVPIYRMRDGLENLDKNQETFEKCREVLRANGTILIFSEGLCIQEMRLRPLKKGTARIAMDFAQSGGTISIVAVGLNYLHPMQFRKEVYIGFAAPFDAAQFLPGYQESQAKGILAFNKKLEATLREEVIHIEDRKRERTFQFAMEIALNHKTHSLHTLVSAANRFNELDQTPERKTHVDDRLKDYAALLSKSNIMDETVAGATTSLPNLLISLILVAPGYLLSWIPFSLVSKLVKDKVKLPEFVDSVRVAGGMIISLLFLLVTCGLVGIFDWQYALLLLGVALICTRISPAGYDGLRAYRSASRYARLAKDKQEQILTSRADIASLVKANLLHD
jgi:1-acyl-sn-glycerol-3-phosphate acyltransferase